MTNSVENYSMEAECAVIGSLLLNNELWDEVSPIIAAQNFYFAAHKIIFTTITKMLSANIPVDLLTLERTLQEEKKLNEVGGLAYLAEIAKSTPTAANITTYANIVRRSSQSRQLYALGHQLCAEVCVAKSQEQIDTIISNTEKALTDLTLNEAQTETNADLMDVIDSILKRMEQNTMTGSVVSGVSFGIERLDANTTGAQDGDLILVAARPSMGKTALSLTFAYSALETQKTRPVQYYSLEMPAEQIMLRLLSLHSRVPLQRVKQGITMSDEDMARYGAAISHFCENWGNARFQLDDSSYLTPQMLRTRVRRNIRKYGTPSVIIVDYLQLMHDPAFSGNKNRNLEIESISRSLKQLAKEVGCPVIALSQLNRNLENRGDKRPLPSDLRDSGSLEQDADIIFFIYRDEVYNPETDMNGIAEIIIAKQRNGPIGTVYSRFKGEFSLFENIPDDEYEKLARE
ncbi:MAG: replicative DNA helicase [[Actinobacillus] rossii]|nr:replicative DNA helicase [[Actinobacillus] rossii]